MVIVLQGERIAQILVRASDVEDNPWVGNLTSTKKTDLSKSKAQSSSGQAVAGDGGTSMTLNTSLVCLVFKKHLNIWTHLVPPEPQTKFSKRLLGW